MPENNAVTVIKYGEITVTKGGATVEHLRSTGRGFNSYTRGKSCVTTFGQVVHTYAPLSPSSITWYWPKGSDAVRLRR